MRDGFLHQQPLDGVHDTGHTDHRLQEDGTPCFEFA